MDPSRGGDADLEHVVKVASARFPHYNVTLFTFLPKYSGEYTF